MSISRPRPTSNPSSTRALGGVPSQPPVAGLGDARTAAAAELGHPEILVAGEAPGAGSDRLGRKGCRADVCSWLSLRNLGTVREAKKFCFIFVQ